jgi:hypothetical protein
VAGSDALRRGLEWNGAAMRVTLGLRHAAQDWRLSCGADAPVARYANTRFAEYPDI